MEAIMKEDSLEAFKQYFLKEARPFTSKCEVNWSKVKMIGGETVSQVSRRWADFAAGLPSGRFLVVTHDLIIRVAVTAAINHNLGQMWQYHLDNCSITTISVDPPKLMGLNYNLHLNGLRSELNRQAL